MLKGERRHRHRAVVIVQVVVLSTVLIGSAALSVDLGMMYMASAELQNAADASAMAAAAELGNYGGTQAAIAAREAGTAYAEMNEVNGNGMTISPSDIVFGRGILQSNGKYVFQPTGLIPDAVRVTVRRTTGSPDGAIPLYFAKIFGFNEANMQASSTAMLIPRDIAIVADLSGSHNYDSLLMHYKITDINDYDVSRALPKPVSDTSELPGPAWGNFAALGWGTQTLDPSSYNPANDPGLVYMKANTTWSSTAIRNALLAKGYSTTEVNDIMSSHSHDWTSQVGVALGLAVWHSGIRGGYADVNHLWNPSRGDSTIASNEVEWVVPYPYPSGSWSDYFNYVQSSSSSMLAGNSNFRYRMGLKTFVDYLLVKRRENDQTPALANTPAQPMQAVKDAVSTMMGIVEDYDGDDYVSLEIYATYGRHEVDLTNDYASITSRLCAMQPGHYDGNTNIGDGIKRGIEELTSDRARGSAKKVMLLLTDGNANTNQYYQWDEWGAKQYAMTMAQQAVSQGIMVYCVTVGADADQSLMAQIAAISNTEDDLFHAGGTIADYSTQLQAIFAQLGGQRPVVLIE